MDDKSTFRPPTHSDDDMVDAQRVGDFLESVRGTRERKLLSERETKIMEAKQADDYIEVFLGTPAGRRVLWDILDRSQLFGMCYEANANTNFNLGKRAIGLYVAQRLGVNNAAGILRLAQLGVEVDRELLALQAEADKEARQ